MTRDPDFLGELGRQLADREKNIEAGRHRRRRIGATSLGVLGCLVLIVGGFALLTRGPDDVTVAADGDPTGSTSPAADGDRAENNADPDPDPDFELDDGGTGVPPGDRLDPWDAAASVIGGEARPGLFWTGDELLVIRTENGGNDVVGERWDPDTNTVTTMADSDLSWRVGAAMAWTGDELLIVGGSSGPALNRIGAAYRPADDRWRPIADPPGDIDGWERTVGGEAVWTGSELFLWRSGLAYDPATDRWRQTEPAPLSTRSRPTVVWTGRDLIVWGGCNLTGAQCDEVNDGLLADGARYDSANDRWTAVPPGPLAPAVHAVGVWTGGEVVIIITDPGEQAAGEQAAAFDPSTETWRSLPSPELSARRDTAAVWYGRQVIVYGGADPADYGPINDGIRYNPADGTTTALADAPGPGRSLHSMAVAGDVVYISAARSASPPLILSEVVCPVTRPPVVPFVPPADWPAVPTGDQYAWYGTDELWTVVDREGHRPRKNVWWSARFPGGTEESAPPLEVRFDRLDREAEPIVFASPGTNAFTEADGWFMINGHEPDLPGCWQATADYKSVSLSYVFEIVDGGSG
ncbi:MAG: hypothetical protein AAGA65_30105 [Actinomycetota bacterium]